MLTSKENFCRHYVILLRFLNYNVWGTLLFQKCFEIQQFFFSCNLRKWENRIILRSKIEWEDSFENSCFTIFMCNAIFTIGNSPIHYLNLAYEKNFFKGRKFPYFYKIFLFIRWIQIIILAVSKYFILLKGLFKHYLHRI